MRKEIKKTVSVLLCAALSMSLLAGCVQDNPASSPSAPQQAAAPSPPPPASTAPEVLQSPKGPEVKGTVVERVEDGATNYYYLDAAGNNITDAYAFYHGRLYYFCQSGKGIYYQVDRVTDHITAIGDAANDRVYLIEGADRAILVDTSSGDGDYRKIVEKLTELPYDVVLTHEHIDHAGGVYDFDRAYIHEDDLETMKNRVLEAGETSRLNYYLYTGNGSQYRDRDVITAGDFPEYKAGVEFVSMTGGQIFDLGGGYTVEVLELPGHTAGSVALLMSQDRMLLTGDAANRFTGLQSSTSLPIETYYKHLQALCERSDEWDKILVSHGANFFYDKTLLDDLLEICDRILNGGELDNVDSANRWGEGAILAMAVDETNTRLDGRMGNIIYRMDNIWEKAPEG